MLLLLLLMLLRLLRLLLELWLVRRRTEVGVELMISVCRAGLNMVCQPGWARSRRVI